MKTFSLPTRATRRALSIAGALIAVGLFVVPTAEAADNTLVSSSPAADSTVDASPPTLQLTFASPLGATNRVDVVCNGTTVPVGQPQVGVDLVSLTVAVPNPLPKGSCTMASSVSQPDGTPGGTVTVAFTVANDPVAAAVPPGSTPAGGSTPTGVPVVAGATDTPRVPGTGSGGPLGLSRLLITLGVAVLFGALVLIATAWPEGVEYILTVRFMRSAWLLTLAFAIFNAACVRAQISGAGVGGSLSPTTWGDLTDTTPGIAALARVIFVALSGWVVLRPERVIDPATQLPALALPGLAVATLGFSRAGGQLALLGYAAGIAHALAMAVWLGGLVLLARVVLAGPGEEDLVHAVRGFARISTPALAATIFTGFIQMYRLDGVGFFDTSHGQVLFLKALAVGAMVFLGVAARQFIKERVARVDAMTGQLAVRLRRAVGIEALCGVLVLALTAWMLSLTPAKVTANTSTGKGLGASAHITNADADVTVKFTGVVGPNAVRVEVAKPVAGVVGLVVDFQPQAGSSSAAVQLNVPLTKAGAAELPITAGVPLSSAGQWTVKVTINGVEIGAKTVLLVNGPAPATTGT